MREMQCHMDVEMFLKGHAGWEVDSPHCPIILDAMLQHTTEQGQKEVECMIHWGYGHSLPKLDPKANVSAIQLVGPQTSKEEFRAQYYEMYKLWRLPESPGGAGMNRGTPFRDGVLPRRLPRAEGG